MNSRRYSSLRITLVCGSLGPGGAERNAARLANGLSKRGHAVTVLTVRPDIRDFFTVVDGVTRVVATGVAADDHRFYNLAGRLRRWRALKKLLVDTSPDVVVTFIAGLNLRVLSALTGTVVPVVVSEVVDLRAHRFPLRERFMRRVLYPRAASVVIVGADSADCGRRVWPRWQTVWIPYAAYPPKAPVEASPWKRSPCVISVGRLTRQKGFDFLLSAFASVRESHSQWSLVIVGDGPLRGALERRAAVLGIDDCVLFPGIVEGIEDTLGCADLFALTSRYEGFPNALIEAMAAGLPVVAFDCPGSTRSIVRDGIDGFIVPCADVPAFSKALAVLMSDRMTRHSMGERARQVLVRFSPDSILDQWEALLADCVPPPGRRGRPNVANTG